MKKLVLIFSLLILVSGCSLVKIESQSFEEIVNTIITGESKLKNVSLEGYSYYLPKGVMLKASSSSNSILYYNHKKMYLYVDLVTYYNKVVNEYQTVDSNYLSMNIDKGKKKGYLDITKVGDRFFVEFMYNYTKIEAYVTAEKDLKKTVTTMAYILNNIKFNDSVLDSLMGEDSLDYNEETFNIFKPKREEGTFLDYEEQYQFGDEKENPDEDEIDLGESIE